MFVLEPHPLDSRILLTAGHDGLIVVWDMLAGVRLKTFQLEVCMNVCMYIMSFVIIVVSLVHNMILG